MFFHDRFHEALHEVFRVLQQFDESMLLEITCCSILWQSKYEELNTQSLPQSAQQLQQVDQAMSRRHEIDSVMQITCVP